jgi:hypothetical protein
LQVGRFEGWNVERERGAGIKCVEAEGAERSKAKSRYFATPRMTPIGMERTGERGAIRRGSGLRAEHGEE